MERFRFEGAQAETTYSRDDPATSILRNRLRSGSGPPGRVKQLGSRGEATTLSSSTALTSPEAPQRSERDNECRTRKVDEANASRTPRRTNGDG